jgi:hypothetical protein
MRFGALAHEHHVLVELPQHASEFHLISRMATAYPYITGSYISVYDILVGFMVVYI